MSYDRLRLTTTYDNIYHSQHKNTTAHFFLLFYIDIPLYMHSFGLGDLEQAARRTPIRRDGYNT
jgi:hypothetical protein